MINEYLDNITIYTVISYVGIFVSVCLYRKNTHILLSKVFFILMTIIVIILFILHFVAFYFTDTGINEAVIYHLKYGVGGAGFSEYIFLIISMISIILLSIGSLIFVIFNKVPTNKIKNNYTLLAFILIIVSIILNPSSFDLYKIKSKQIKQRKIQIASKGKFYDYYQIPTINFDNKKHKNIVFIYAESLERTYFDENSFPGLITELKKLESKSISFTNVSQIEGTGWTVGGMTASTCGIPLFTPANANGMTGMDNFLISAKCLGDILKDAGYQFSFVGGADIDFAGKGNLLSSHGFESVVGIDELDTEIVNAKNKGTWGLHDDVLFDVDYKKFEELSQSGENFGLFTLTLDTHSSGKDISKKCKGIIYGDGTNDTLNIVKCSDYLISNFIKKIITSPYFDNTTVVLVSDHLAMHNNASNLLQNNDRKNLFMIFDSNITNERKINTSGSTLDTGATLLSYMNFTEKLGLGRSLFNSSEEFNDAREFIGENVGGWKEDVLQFWKFPKIEKAITVDTQNNKIIIDDRQFDMPVLIEMNKNLETILSFKFYNDKDSEVLLKNKEKISSDKYFLLIDTCKTLEKIYKPFEEGEYCLIAGKGSVYTKMLKLNNDIQSFTVNDLKDILKIN